MVVLTLSYVNDKSGFLIFIVIVLAHIGGDFLDQDKRDLMGVPFFAMTIVRTWLVATLTFKKNDSNQQRNADQERERKRQIEIQDALEKRKEREEGIHFSTLVNFI